MQWDAVRHMMMSLVSSNYRLDNHAENSNLALTELKFKLLQVALIFSCCLMFLHFK